MDVERLAEIAGCSARSGHQALASLILSICFGLGTLLVSCAPENGDDGNAPDPTTAALHPTTAAPVKETTAARVEENTNPRQPNIAEAVAAAIDETSIRKHLSRLTGASPAPLEGGTVTIAERGSVEGRRAAAEYMEESFEVMGIPARVREFRSGSLHGFNVEATLKGTEGEKHLWVTAHLDSVGVPGANDDASGLTSILLTAKALEEIGPEHTVHFVAYDLEEVGLFGSTHYVENTVNGIVEREGKRAIIGNLHSDMIGYDPDNIFDAIVGTCDQAGSIDDALRRASEAIDSRIELYETCLGRSDHIRFWEDGLPATVLVEGVGYNGYPCYHQSCDTIDMLNISYLRSMIQLTATTTALLAAPENASTN
jgi:hypothetical protein